MNTNINPQNNCHSSVHSVTRPISIEETVYSIISSAEHELTPIEVSQKAHKNHASIRKALRRLLEKNKIYQPYPGAYCNKITYGMIFVPLKIHNIGLRFNVVGDLDSWVFDEVVGDVKIHVCFGSQRRKVSGYIADDFGMSKDACLFAIHRWLDIVEDRLGYVIPEPFELTSFEQNRDFGGVKLEGGFKCITKNGLDGMIERVYQKEEGLVRAEHKITKSMSLTEFEALLQGGVSGYNQTQAQFALMQQVGHLTEALKFTNSRLLEMEKQNQAMMKWIMENTPIAK